jgi:hypothetical protein
MEVQEEALLVDGGLWYHFDVGLHVRHLCWAVLAGTRQEKRQADRLGCSRDSHKENYINHTIGMAKLEVVHVVGQTEHMGRNFVYVNMAVGNRIHVEEVPAPAESMEGARWRPDKDTWAGVVRADRFRIVAVFHTSLHRREVGEVEDGWHADSMIVGLSRYFRRQKAADLC